MEQYVHSNNGQISVRLKLSTVDRYNCEEASTDTYQLNFHLQILQMNLVYFLLQDLVISQVKGL